MTPSGGRRPSAPSRTSPSPVAPIERALIGALAPIKGWLPSSTAGSACSTTTWRRRSHDAAAEVAAGSPRRALPHRRVPDRVGHVEQHERQRGDRDARHRAARPRRAPQRPRQRVAVVERRVPVGHPHRRDPRRRPRPGARADAPAGVAVPQGGRARRRREERAHPPHGRDAGDARPGVRRLRRAGAPAASSGSRRRCPGSASCPSAAPRSAPASTRRPASPRTSSAGWPATSGCR